MFGVNNERHGIRSSILSFERQYRMRLIEPEFQVKCTSVLEKSRAKWRALREQKTLIWL